MNHHEKIVHEAQKVTSNDLLIKLNPSKCLDGLMVDVKLATEMPSQLVDECMSILIENVKTYYINSITTNWSDKDKRAELMHPLSRFIFIQNGNNLAGFIMFRFDTEENDEEFQDENMDMIPVIYCYELQISRSFQRRGIGSFLLSCLEQLGIHFQMKKSMLTTFKENIDAYRFYTRCEYVEDGISPGQILRDDPQESSKYDYWIMSKRL